MIIHRRPFWKSLEAACVTLSPSIVAAWPPEEPRAKKNSIKLKAQKKGGWSGLFCWKEIIGSFAFRNKTHAPCEKVRVDYSRMLSCSSRCWEIFQMPSVFSTFRSSLTRLWWYSSRKSARKPTENSARSIPEKVDLWSSRPPGERESQHEPFRRDEFLRCRRAVHR